MDTTPQIKSKDSILSRNLRHLRSLRGWTQEQTADKILKTRFAYSRWESGEHEPDVSSIKELAKTFNTSVDQLLGVDIARTSKRETIKCCIENQGL